MFRRCTLFRTWRQGQLKGTRGGRNTGSSTALIEEAPERKSLCFGCDAQTREEYWEWIMIWWSHPLVSLLIMCINVYL